MKYPIYLQENINDCGPTCIKMILKFYQQNIQLKELKKLTKVSTNGVSIYGLLQCLKQCNVDAKAMQGTIEQLIELNSFPCIIHINKNGLLHYIVLYNYSNDLFTIGDPEVGKVFYSKEQLEKVFTGVCIQIAFVGIVPMKYKEESFNTFCFKQLKYYKKEVLNILFNTLVFSLISILLSSYFQIIIDYFMDKNNLQFMLFTIFFIIITILKSGLDFRIKHCFLDLILDQDKNIVLHTIQQLVYLEHQVIEQNKSSLLIHKINSLESLSIYINQIFTVIFIDGIFIILLIFALYLLSPILALIMCIIFVILSCLFYVLLEKMAIYVKKSVEDKEQFQVVMGDYVDNIKMIKQFQIMKFYRDKVGYYFDLKQHHYKLKELNFYKIKVFLDTVMQCVLYGLTIYSFYLYRKDVLTFGSVTLIYMLISYSFEPLITLASLLVERKEQVLLYYRYRSLLSSRAKRKNRIKKIKSIQLEYVDYGYGYGQYQLENINVCIDKSFILKGEIGCGKSTLLQLLMGYDTPTKGMVLLNQKPFDSYDLHSIYGQMIYLDKKPILYEETLAFNILLEEQSEEEMDYLIKLFKVEELYKYMNNIMGSTGGLLSSGQQQIVLLIRSLLKKPSVLILDEALCNVDKTRLNIIFDYLFNERNDIIKIVVSHQTNIVYEDVLYGIIKEKKLYMENNNDN